MTHLLSGAQMRLKGTTHCCIDLIPCAPRCERMDGVELLGGPADSLGRCEDDQPWLLEATAQINITTRDGGHLLIDSRGVHVSRVRERRIEQVLPRPALESSGKARRRTTTPRGSDLP